jgi:hypothetical protein
MFRLMMVTVWLAALAIAQGPLGYETKRIEKKSAGCVVSFEYPEITSAASPQVRDRINAGVLGVMMRSSGWPAPDSGARSLDAYVKMSFEGCAQFHNWAKGTVADRELYEHKIIEVFRSSPPVFSLQCVADEDGGGVHPFGTTFYVNFYSGTGKSVKLADVLQPGALPRLRSIAELQFRKDHKLSVTESLSNTGFSFPGDAFQLNDNYGIGEKALVFVFNTYEIAAGAMGETRIEIPYADMSHLLKPGSGLVP